MNSQRFTLQSKTDENYRRPKEYGELPVFSRRNVAYACSKGSIVVYSATPRCLHCIVMEHALHYDRYLVGADLLDTTLSS
jgi:hypothetical protein